MKRELEKHGYKVWVPDLPESEIPNIKRYNKFIFSKWKFNKDSIIVGHSSGAVAILGILEQLPRGIKINKAVFIAGFLDALDADFLKELFIQPFDYRKIKSKANKFVLFHSDNDPYVPLWQGEKLRDLLGGELIVMKGQAHFSTTTYPGDKYLQFPKLLEKILE